MWNHRRVNHLPGTGSAGTLDPLRCVTACNPSCCANCINLQMGRPGPNCEAQLTARILVEIWWSFAMKSRHTSVDGREPDHYVILRYIDNIQWLSWFLLLYQWYQQGHRHRHRHHHHHHQKHSHQFSKNETPESACREEADGDNKPHSQSFARLKLWMKVSPGVLGYWKIPWYPLVDIHFYIFFVKIGDYWGFHLDMFVSCRVSFIWLVASNWKSRPVTAPGAMPLQTLLQCCRRRARRGCGPAEVTAWPDLIGGYRQLLRPNSTIRTLFSKHECDPM